jgi:adenylate cyclase
MSGLFFLLVYELAVAAWLGRLLRRGAGAPAAWRWINLTIEISIGTFLMAMVTYTFDPLLGLFGPPSYTHTLIIFLAVLNLAPRLCLFAGALAAAQLLVLVVGLRGDIALQIAGAGPIGDLTSLVVRSVGTLLIGGIAALIASEIKAWVLSTMRVAEERRQVLDLFGKQVSPEVVNKLLEQPAGLTSELKDVCVMFLDIRGFTTFSESRSPQEVIRYLNTLFDAMITCINEHNGIINKFLGDGFMAVFGAPVGDSGNSQSAVQASIELIAIVERLVTEGTIPPTRIGIGLHAGHAITGNVGSHLRREYTVIGDVVNTAARIEALNKRFESCLLVSDVVYQSLDDAVSGAEKLPPVMVKGRSEPVVLWRLA